MKRDQTISRAKIASQPYCTKCFATDRLHAHHIEALVDGGEDHPDNLDTLCSFCHNEWHRSAEGVMDYSQYVALPPGRFFAMMAAMPEYRQMTLDALISMWPELKAKGVGEPLAKSARADAQRKGIANAQALGRYRGRKPSYTQEQLEIVTRMVAQGDGVSAIASESGLSRQTIYRIKADPMGAAKILSEW